MCRQIGKSLLCRFARLADHMEEEREVAYTTKTSATTVEEDNKENTDGDGRVNREE